MSIGAFSARIHRPFVRKKERRPWSRAKVIKTALAWTALSILLVVSAAALYVTVLIARIRPTIASLAEISAFHPREATSIWSSDGILLARLEVRRRKVVPLKQISHRLIDATISYEDSRFYAHGALDYRGLARAAVADLLQLGEVEQGGSTITQQLARSAAEFHVGRKKNMARKLRESMIAMRLEQAFSKDEILELYFNEVYYGSGAYGAEAAAETYFSTTAKELSLPECALLVCLAQRPSLLSAPVDQNAVRNKRNLVLARMLKMGKIDSGEFQRASEAPIAYENHRMALPPRKAPYFMDWIERALVARFGQEALYSGWKVVSTLDSRMQSEAERSVRNGLRFGATQAALVCIDPHNGEVRAMVGGVDYKKNQFNACTQGRRQPGSAFKPIVYAAAMDSGAVNLETTFLDERRDFGSPHSPWFVRNYSNTYSNRAVTVREGIVRSTNTIAVQAGLQAGLDSIVDYAHRFGFSDELEKYPSLTLGACAVRPIELCAAFGVFASNGERYRPTGITSVSDEYGKAVYRDDPAKRREPNPITVETTLQLNQALRDVVLRGTGTAASGVPNACGKTGTTSDRKDAWFVGYTPELVAAVWMASPHRDEKGVITYRPMPGATGGYAAAPLWARFMAQAAPIQRQVNRVKGTPKWEVAVPPPAYPLNALLASKQRKTNEMTAALQSSQNWVRSQRQNGVYEDGSSWHGYRSRDEVEGSSEVNGDAESHRICADSGDLATEWCPITMMVHGNNVSRRMCRLHHAPPGESGGPGAINGNGVSSLGWEMGNPGRTSNSGPE